MLSLGIVTSARLGRNLHNQLIDQSHNSEIFVGGGSSVIARTFSGSADMPFLSITCPRNLREPFENSHFLGLRVTPTSRAAFSLLSCPFGLLPNTRMSSIQHNTEVTAISKSTHNNIYIGERHFMVQ